MAGDEQTDSSGKYAMSGHGRNSSGPKYWPTIFKGLELIFSIICIGLIDEPTNNPRSKIFITQRSVGLAYATFGAYIIFTTVYLLGKVVKDNWPWKTSAVLSFVGSALYIACAAALLADWANTKERNYWPPNVMRLDLLCACGFISLAAGIIFLIDLILTLWSGIKGRFDE